MTIAQTVPIKGYGPWEFSSTSGGAAALGEVHTTSLVTADLAGAREARVAARIPSFDDGSITLLPDGRMETVWRLRDGIKWQDGTPLTGDDLVFSWQIAADADLASSLSPHIRHVEAMEVVDPLTVRMTWKTTYFRALDLDHRNFWLFPKHILGEALQAGEREAFLSLPYFTTEYVNLGPFRLVDFGLGEQQVFEAYDGFFLGKPKIQRIVIRTILDPNAMVANLKSRAIDMISEKTLSSQAAVLLRDEWEQTREGTLVYRQDNWLYVSFQFDARWAHPVEISRDVRIRQALYQAIDREAIREFALPGFPDTNGDGFVPKNDPRAAIAGQPFARYPYDPTRATQLFAEAGWNRAADGPLLGQDGRQVQIETRGQNQTWVKETALVADFWRQMGIDATELIPPPALSRDREHSATFPSLVIRARGSGDGILVAFDSRLQQVPPRWRGANTSHYANPRLDGLIDRLEATIELRDQGAILRDIGELMATDLPAVPLYFRNAYAAIRSGVHALADDYAGIQEAGDMARNAHRWEIR